MYGSIGKLGIASRPLATNQAIAFTETGEIHNLYLFYFLLYVRNKLASLGKGATQLNISQTVIKAFPFALAPKREQQRIVAKIEELFSELDKGIESLKTAQAQLKVYRQALLKHAFEGKLTAQWRADNPDKLEATDALLERIQRERAERYQQQVAAWETQLSKWADNQNSCGKPIKPRKAARVEKPSSEHKRRMWDIPKGWQWLQIGEFSFVTKLAGFEYTKFVRYSEDGDLRVIKAENASRDGFRETQYSRVCATSVAELTRTTLSGGELLMVFVGAGTGNVASVPIGQKFFLGPNIGMMRIETDFAEPKYVELFLRSPLGKELALAASKAVAQPSLSMEAIRQIPIAIPPVAEQKLIVAAIEDKLSILEKTESEVETQISNAELLRQSILKKAFSGQLVHQDPTDEPASELLARIKAEQTATPKNKKARK